MPKQITHDKYERVKVLTEGGMPYRKACKEAKVSHYGLDLYAKRNELPPLQKPRQNIKTRVIELLDDYTNKRITQYDIAEKLNCSQCAVSKALQSVLPPGLTKANNRSSSQEKRKQRYKDYEKIFEYVKENGGYALHAAKAMGIELQYPQEMRDYAKQIGLDLDLYKMAGRKYGAWITLPGEWIKKPPANYYVPAICTRCGTKYDFVQINNLASGKSKCCHKCNAGKKYRRFRIRRVSDGKVYRSIRAMCAENNHLKSYQQCRLKIMNEGAVTINEERFELLS